MKRSRTRPGDLVRGGRYWDACPCVGDDECRGDRVWREAGARAGMRLL
jgi:hypothetical protein